VLYLNKKNIFGVIFASFLLLSVSFSLPLQAKTNKLNYQIDKKIQTCSICPIPPDRPLYIVRPLCILLGILMLFVESVIFSARIAGLTDTADYLEEAVMTDLRMIHEIWCFW